MWKFKESKKSSLVVTQTESAGKQRVICGQDEWEGKERQAAWEPVILLVYTKD